MPPIFTPTDLYGVVGCPLGQSLSPLLHNTAFQTLGIPAVYLQWEIPPQKLAAFVESIRLLNIQGVSITIPHKITIMPLLDFVGEQASLAGAVNTVYREGDKLYGENTDVTGFLSPLADMETENADVLLLGAGGAAHAVAAGLSLRRFRQIFVATPSDHSHLPLAERFDCIPLPWKERHDISAHLIINATPLGMRGKQMEETPFDFGKSAGPHGSQMLLAYDIVYNPLETRFLREARSHGRRCVSGLSMFLGQGAAQFKLWTGHELPDQAGEALKAKLRAMR
jgi:shikimate dehydrogenase